LWLLSLTVLYERPAPSKSASANPFRLRQAAPLVASRPSAPEQLSKTGEKAGPAAPARGGALTDENGKARCYPARSPAEVGPAAKPAQASLAEALRDLFTTSARTASRRPRSGERLSGPG
jgi:hypothetical protein